MASSVAYPALPHHHILPSDLPSNLLSYLPPLSYQASAHPYHHKSPCLPSTPPPVAPHTAPLVSPFPCHPISIRTATSHLANKHHPLSSPPPSPPIMHTASLCTHPFPSLLSKYPCFHTLPMCPQTTCPLLAPTQTHILASIGPIAHLQAPHIPHKNCVPQTTTSTTQESTTNKPTWAPT